MSSASPSRFGRGELRRVATVLLACVAIVALSVPSAAAKAGKPPRDPNLERLWSEYPLNPEPRTKARPSPRPAPVEPIGRRPAPAPAKARGSDSLLAALLVVVALLLAAGAAFAWRRAWRPQLGARGRSQPKKEGETMSDFVRRLLGEDREDASEVAVGSKSSRRAPTLDRMKAYSTKGDEAMHEKPGSVPDARGTESYAHLGEHVAAILKATEQAAEEMRRKAQEDADKTRRQADHAASASTEEAKRRIEADRHELEKQRSELEQRTQQMHAEADSYREQTRRQAEKEAAEIGARAAEAAKQLQDDAVRLQKWMEGTLTAFHEVTSWLEDALAKTRGEPVTEEASLEEALKPKDYAKST